MRVVIYGAQGTALGTYLAIETVYPEVDVECFLVSEQGENSLVLRDKPVMELVKFVEGLPECEKENIYILIATPESVMPDIEEKLHGVGLNNWERIVSTKYAELQQMMFAKTGEFKPLSMFSKGKKRPTITIFKMVHEKDRKLGSCWDNPDYMINLQVGALGANKKIGDLLDSSGENISNRNGNYSELTGLYWVWKNFLSSEKNNQYCGLAHYRRVLDLSEEDVLKLKDNKIDVVLPYPMPYEPNCEAHHLRYLSDTEWGAVVQALEEMQPEYEASLKQILKQEYFYNYNIILAKGSVLKEYCDWLFPLLFRIEKINDPEGKKKPNRYIGYVAETLETLYFMHNKDALRIAHVGCRFLV